MLFVSEKNSFYLLIKPFLKFCLKNSIKVQEITEMIKQALIEIACEELEKNSHPHSISKISAITGLQRRDISKLIDKPKEALSNNNIITKIIGQWQYDKRFTSEDGTPLKLSINGKTSEFSKLVSSVSLDINPYAVLFELERLELVKKENNNAVLCFDFNLLGKNNLLKVINMVAKQKSDLLSAVEENLENKSETPNLHIVTEFDNVNPIHLAKLKKWILKKGSEFHAQMRNEISKYDQDINPSITNNLEGVRVTVSAFSRIENMHFGEENEK